MMMYVSLSRVPVNANVFQIRIIRKRMKDEAKIARQLHHPSVTNFIGLFVESNSVFDEKTAEYYLVSDLVNGGLARAYLAVNRKPKVAEKLLNLII